MVHAYYVCKDVWDAVFGEELLCKREPGTCRDPFTLAMVGSWVTVGHVSCTPWPCGVNISMSIIFMAFKIWYYTASAVISSWIVSVQVLLIAHNDLLPFNYELPVLCGGTWYDYMVFQVTSENTSGTMQLAVTVQLQLVACTQHTVAELKARSTWLMGASRDLWLCM